jgi:hypothetical protein
MLAHRSRRQGLRALRALAACGRLRTLTAALRCAPGLRAILPGKRSRRKTMTKLITDDQLAVLRANGLSSRSVEDFDPAPVVKLFTPDAGATWLLTEIDPDDPDHAFGLYDLGVGFPELGWVSLADLRTVRGHMGLAVERDLHFRAEKRLSAYAREARMAGRIMA